ncbi:MAG: hypothetical protein ABI743_00955 [bacterium]
MTSLPATPPEGTDSPAVDPAPAVSQATAVAPAIPEIPEEEGLPEISEGPHDERGLPDFRRRKKEPRTFEEKLRAYKKQSQERLLDVKRSREAKIGGKKTTGGRGR